MLESLKSLLSGIRKSGAERTEPAPQASAAGEPASQPQAGTHAPDGGSIDVGIVSEGLGGMDKEEVDALRKQLALSNERLTDMEAKVAKFTSTLSVLAKENDSLKSKMEQNDARLLDMLSVYEVVSSQINPFVGSSKVMSSSLDQMQSDLEKLKGQVSLLAQDMSIMARSRLDLTKLLAATADHAEEKRKVDLTRLIQTAMQTKRAKLPAKQGTRPEYGP